MRRVVLSLTGACLLALVLVGCMSGDGVQGAFEREFADDPAVVSVDLSTADRMPLSGGVSGTVVLRDGLDEAQVREFADRLIDFRDRTDGDGAESRVRIDVAVNGWRFPVLATEEASAALLDVVFTLNADTRVLTGTISSADYRGSIDHASLVASATAEIPALITAVPAAFAAKGEHLPITLSSPDDEPSGFEVSGTLGTWAEEAFHAYEALRAETVVTSFQAEKGTIEVVLGNEADVDSARSVISDALGSTPFDVFYQSDLVILFPGARGDQARELLQAMDDESRASIVSVWTDDRSATVSVRSLASVRHVVAQIDAAPLPADFLMTVAMGQGDHEIFSLQAPPRELAADVRTAVALFDRKGVKALNAKPGFSMKLDFESAPSADDLMAVAAPLRALSELDERLCITWPDEVFCMQTAAELDPSGDEFTETRNGRAFADAWNSAP